MITIPFDLERAKRIQAGEEPGKIITRNGLDVRVVCWDLQKENFPIIAAISQDGDEDIYYRTAEGRVRSYGRIESDCDLILQVPEWTQFKDGDILATENGNCFILNGNGEHKTSCYVGLFYYNLSFGGCASLDNIEAMTYASEEHRQKLIDELKNPPTHERNNTLNDSLTLRKNQNVSLDHFRKYWLATTLVAHGLPDYLATM